MRTRTTTRESLKISEANYPLLMFLWENGMQGPYEKLKKLMLVKIVEDPSDVTEDDDEAFRIKVFLKSKL